MSGTVSVEMCSRCGSLEWVYSGRYGHVWMGIGDDGSPVLTEWELEGDFQCSCSFCDGSTLTISGSPEVFRELKKLDGKERILRALELAIEDRLIFEDPFDPEEIFDMLCPSKFGKKFDEKVKGLLAKLKLLE